MPHTKIKICGVTRAEDVLAAAQHGAHAVGLNFAPESPRCLRDMNRASNLAQTAHAHKLKCAGVFVNAAAGDIEKIANELRLDIVQLHGEESAAFAGDMKNRLKRLEIWKAVRVSRAADLSHLAEYDCDAWLIDAKTDGLRGGSGKSFDWSILQAFTRQRPIVLAGGLNPRNIVAAISSVHPEWVDTASGVESAPGIKDATLIHEFCECVNKISFLTD